MNNTALEYFWDWCNSKWQN